MADDRVQLWVKTSDAQSEIILLDNRGRLLDRGFGPERRFDLERGIYRVKILTGTEVQEKTVVLTDQASQTVEFAPAAFASPVPLVGTSTSHEYHVAAADRESRRTHVQDGTGSSLFFLVRDWTPNRQASAEKRVTGNPATGLSLHEMKNGERRKIADLAQSGTANLDLDPWCACTVAVNPGVYQLRLELPSGEALEHSIVASRGWQTQVFMFLRGYSAGRVPEESAGIEWRADLARTSIMLRRNPGFAYSEPMLRLAELARVALAIKKPTDSSQPGRPLLPDELRTLLRGKSDDPMLGIYAAHLLLLEATPDLSLLDDIVGHVRDLLGPTHPDVEALALRSRLRPEPKPFEHPPMLRRSWSLIVDASFDRPELATEALEKRMTADLWSEGPWHVWKRTNVAATAPSDHDDLSDLEAALAADLRMVRKTPALPPILLNVAPGQRYFEVHPTRGLRGFDFDVQTAISSGKQTNAFEGLGGATRAGAAGIRSGGRSTVLQPSIRLEEMPEQSFPTVDAGTEHARAIARRFSLTPTQLAHVLGTLQDKLQAIEASSTAFDELAHPSQQQVEKGEGG